MINKLKILLGSGFGVGLIPLAPGTLASLTALIPIFFLLQYDFVYLVPVLALSAALITLWTAPYFEQKWGTDTQKLVMDEWAGQSVVFIGSWFTGAFSTDIIILLTGFFLFRLFDIWKPLGINRLQQLKDGWGVLADDILAGLYALICLKTLIFMWPKYFGLA